MPISQPQYISVSDADDYFETRLDSDLWFTNSPERKTAALITATRAISQLQFVGIKADDTQELDFPRMGQTEIPQEILIACCEEALLRLDGLDPEMEMASLSNVNTTYAGVRDTYDRTIAVEHMRAGIMSSVAWTFLKPWLAESLNFTISRV